MGCHPTHKTRISLDASSYDEICILCGATDYIGGWGELANPCTNPEKPVMDKQKEAFDKAIKEDRYCVATRMAYADWLMEQGLDDEAEVQRYEATFLFLLGDNDATRKTASQTY